MLQKVIKKLTFSYFKRNKIFTFMLSSKKTKQNSKESVSSLVVSWGGGGGGVYCTILSFPNNFDKISKFLEKDKSEFALQNCFR